MVHLRGIGISVGAINEQIPHHRVGRRGRSRRGSGLSREEPGVSAAARGAWEESPECDRLMREEGFPRTVAELPDHFFRRVLRLLENRGLVMAGWEEIALTNPFYVAGPKSPNPMGVESEIEVRPVFEAEDFGDEFTPELREQEQRLRERLEAEP
jgi:hypothetical protein